VTKFWLRFWNFTAWMKQEENENLQKELAAITRERDAYMGALLELEDRLMLPPADTHTDVIFRCCALVQAALAQGAKVREEKP
jgi:hypothetical protein